MIKKAVFETTVWSAALTAMFLCFICSGLAGAKAPGAANAVSESEKKTDSVSAEDIIRSYVEDFKEDPTAGDSAWTFGVQVRDSGTWTISIDDDGTVESNSGKPSTPTFFYITDLETLRDMDSGELAVFTAMGKASSSDYAPMDFEFMEGYQPSEDFMEVFVPFTFHFWTKGIPEMVRFGDEKYTRVVHGANVVALYYQKGLRSAWYQIEKGQHINEPAEDQTNPFPTLVVFTRGKAMARIGGKEIPLEEGRSVLIPAGVPHEFWNDRDMPAEFIIIMFGEGA